MPGEEIVERLTAALRQGGLDPTPLEIADAVWLAIRIASLVESDTPVEEVVAGVASSGRQSGQGRGAEKAAIPAQRPSGRDGRNLSDKPVAPATRAGGPARDDADLRVDTSDRESAEAVPFWTPDAPELDRREVAKALRPLKRRLPSPGRRDLDASATADRAARTALAGRRIPMVPVFQDRLDRWLDLAVVVDDSASMVVSRRLVQEFVAAIRETGAFRDVRVWHLDSDAMKDGIRLRAEHPESVNLHEPAALIDSRGRRLVLVASDCVGRGWRDGSMAETLQMWGKAGPVAIVQPLPQTMWERAGLDVRVVGLSAVQPGAANGDLRIELRDEPFGSEPDDDWPTGIAIPVLELNERWLAGWARLVGDVDGRVYTGPAVFTGAMTSADWSDPADTDISASTDAQTALARFGFVASPDAVLLARMLAAASPLTLPVMRLIRRAMLPASDPTSLREVFLGGLLVQRGDPVHDPEETIYDFPDATRNELISQLSSGDAWRVLAEVSRYLTTRLGSGLDFRAILTRPSDDFPDVGGSGRAFAKVAVQVLKSMGGSYADTAAHLQELLREPLSAEAELVSARLSETSGDLSMTGTLTPVIVPARPVGYEPAGWKTVPLKNPNFVGREQMLLEMQDLLVNSEQTAVLLPRAFYGLGGVGKTQLAIEYAHRHMHEFDLVWWIAAEDPAEIRRSLVELADVLEVAVAGDTRSTVLRVLNRLNRPKDFNRWLLVFDNVGDPESVRGLLPSAQVGQVLITSRETSWESEGQSVAVDKFARPESIQLLWKHAELPATEAEMIADRLDDLPISLAQAAAWLAATRKPHTDYLQRLNEEMARHRSTDGDPGYPPHAAAAMSIAFDGLRLSSEDAALLLQLSSYFGPEWITLDLIYRGRYASGLTRRLGKTLRDHAPLQRAVKEIARWELARNDTRNVRFQVHRLVRHMVQTEMAEDLSAEVLDTVRIMLAVANPGNPDRIPAQEAIKHAELSAHITAAGLIDSDDLDARQVVLDQIRYRYITGDYESSLALADETLGHWREADELTLIARRHRASAIAALGRHEEAYEVGEEVRDGFQRMLGRDHEHTMATVNGIGRDLRALGRFSEAFALDKDNLERQIRILGPEDRSTIRTANSYAVDLRMLGEYEQALERDRQTEAESRRAFGPTDSSTLMANSNVARDLYALGRYSEALRVQLDSLRTYEETSGANHPEVLLARRTLVMIQRKLGHTAEAVVEGESLLLAFRNRLGDRHPNTLLVMQSVMNALRNNNDPANGDLDRAIELGEEALAGYEAALPDHPFRQICVTNLAVVYRNKSEDLAKRARQMNEAALENLTRFFGPDNPYTLCCATNLANDLAASRDFVRARDLSGDVLIRSRLVRGESQPYTLACAVNHAIDLMKTNDPGGAEAYAEAIRDMEMSPDLGPNHPEVAQASMGKRIDCDIEAPPT